APSRRLLAWYTVLAAESDRAWETCNRCASAGAGLLSCRASLPLPARPQRNERSVEFPGESAWQSCEEKKSEENDAGPSRVTWTAFPVYASAAAGQSHSRRFLRPDPASE